MIWHIVASKLPHIVLNLFQSSALSWVLTNLWVTKHPMTWMTSDIRWNLNIDKLEWASVTSKTSNAVETSFDLTQTFWLWLKETTMFSDVIQMLTDPRVTSHNISDVDRSENVFLWHFFTRFKHWPIWEWRRCHPTKLLPLDLTSQHLISPLPGSAGTSRWNWKYKGFKQKIKSLSSSVKSSSYRPISIHLSLLCLSN